MTKIYLKQTLFPRKEDKYYLDVAQMLCIPYIKGPNSTVRPNKQALNEYMKDYKSLVLIGK